MGIHLNYMFSLTHQMTNMIILTHNQYSPKYYSFQHIISIFQSIIWLFDVMLSVYVLKNPVWGGTSGARVKMPLEVATSHIKMSRFEFLSSAESSFLLRKAASDGLPDTHTGDAD